MASSPPRILLCGDVLGRLNQLYKRVLSVNKSTGPFDALLCVGQFFPDSVDELDEVANFLEGRSQVPIPTYFTGDYGVGAARFLSSAVKLPSNKGFKTDGLEICPNLYWLRASGKFSLHGLSVVYLYGAQSQDADAGVWNSSDLSEAPPGVSDLSGSDPTVAELVAEIKPRHVISYCWK
ncbi:hypothetical protein HPP92_008933 [Vanilla planifolia]|uniref:Zinc finger CCCH domain-containing protein 64 n=1 Tax=Vanilla planifolia TaxID=51239 RepID=A0A835RAJ5_VANPL|nr:hypothetical protein HPP92_008933 [Vanilla planifolia]